MYAYTGALYETNIHMVREKYGTEKKPNIIVIYTRKLLIDPTVHRDAI